MPDKTARLARVLIFALASASVSKAVAADRPLFVYSRAIVSRGDGTNCPVIFKYHETGAVVETTKDPENRVHLYQDVVLQVYCGKPIKPLADQKVLSSPLKFEQQHGLRVGHALSGEKWTYDNDGPYYSPMLPAIFAVPPKTIWDHEKAPSLWPLEIRLQGETIQANWALNAEKKLSDIELDGPVVGRIQNKMLGIGGSLHRRVAADGDHLLESKANLVFSIDKDVYLGNPIEAGEIDNVRRLLDGSNAVVTVDETIVETAGTDEAMKLPLSNRIIDLLSELKK